MNILQINQHHPSPRLIKSPIHQKGVALYVVIVMVLLSMLLALWASRTSLFNEMLVGNDADYQRAFEAAQAMLQDAEMDIRGVNSDGTLCVVDATDGDICRRTTSVYFEFETKDIDTIFSTIESQGTAAAATKCFKGICQKRTDPQDFWNDKTILGQMISLNVGARYGQFTGAKYKSDNKTGNPILNDRTLNATDPSKSKGAWYWIEILPYVDQNISLLGNMPPGANILTYAPSRKKPFIYRITALARGLKPGTEVVLQSTLSIKPSE